MKQIIDNVSLEQLTGVLENCICVRNKRERSVFTDGQYFYKIWVPDWSYGDCTKAAIDSGYYNKITAPALLATISDASGQRGYIMDSGTRLDKYGGKDWTELIEKTTKKQRKDFILELLKRSLESKGIHADFAASNVILYKGNLSLIDLESFTSFSFIFNGIKEWYEKFPLDAWWKPLETSRRDLNLFYKDYLSSCLGIQYNNEINSEGSIEEIIKEIQK